MSSELPFQDGSENIDLPTVAGFGKEWQAFNQSEFHDALHSTFHDYFKLIDLDSLPIDAKVLDVGCGSGRWGRFLAPLVGDLHLLDPSTEALQVARNNLSGFDNCSFHLGHLGEGEFSETGFDLVYSLGVLHHVPDTRKAIADCAKVLNEGAPLLLYLYYRFDNRSRLYASLWKCSDIFRRIIFRLPFGLKRRITDVIALFIYWPLARLSRHISRLGRDVSSIPLSFYMSHSLYAMRTDSLDRFGTRLEQRFTRAEIHEMMIEAGLERISFSETEPYWCAVGYRTSALHQSN